MNWVQFTVWGNKCPSSQNSSLLADQLCGMLQPPTSQQPIQQFTCSWAKLQQLRVIFQSSRFQSNEAEEVAQDPQVPTQSKGKSTYKKWTNEEQHFFVDQ